MGFYIFGGFTVMENLVTKWIEATETQLNKQELSKDQLDAITSIIELCDNSPEKAYEAICLILKSNPRDKVIAVLGAGPLEELLVLHCSLIDRVIVDAEKNQNLITCLKSVYLDEKDCLDYYKIDNFLEKNNHIKSGTDPVQ